MMLYHITIMCFACHVIHVSHHLGLVYPGVKLHVQKWIESATSGKKNNNPKKTQRQMIKRLSTAIEYLADLILCH
jgi:hypothetical protein